MNANIQISNLTEAQVIAIEDLLATWVYLGGIGSSRWTSFYADGDGNFHPKISINGHDPEFSKLMPRKEVWNKDTYKIDLDEIAWKLDQEKEFT